MPSCSVEEFAPIPGFDNYQASNYGYIQNRKTGKRLKTYIPADGFPRVTLYQNGINYTKRVARLVALAFAHRYNQRKIIDYLDFSIVQYLDGNKTNTALNNLYVKRIWMGENNE